ncbi:bleomycin resistance protein [Streptomyces sp. NRRL F-4489]|uniref:VOC family protein n=1 Tax=Streptomyces sp. NRRL F-4489 TaxID=1609095 RepID=UPI0007478665|nr:VOC family protein [Streptomyces sp. NRRL F-4489]KUL38695.1 bleomycin resistance protein [Streptomyces sp. NRRL F-4489]
MPSPRPTPPVHGAPCWVSLMARDLPSAQTFYGAVLGWRFRQASLGEEFSVALRDGEPVAGIGALAPSLQVPVAWMPYFAVADADDTAARIRERGATVAVGPLKLGPGRAALAADPDGATFGFWEGRTASWRVGAGSAPAILELRTRDAFAAAIFYAGIFDWASERPGGCEVTYEHDQVIVHDGTHVVAALRGGGVEAAPDPRVRPQWHVHFRVRDIAAVTEAAVEAGGTVTPVTATQDGKGSQALVRDPDGGLFTVTAPGAPV